jgi:hypothetical protein
MITLLKRSCVWLLGRRFSGEARKSASRRLWFTIVLTNEKHCSAFSGPRRRLASEFKFDEKTNPGL